MKEVLKILELNRVRTTKELDRFWRDNILANNKKESENIFAQAKYDLTDNSTGKKYDAGKPMVGTLARVFPHALMAIGQCIEFGTHKYPDPNNWKKVDGAKNRYLDSLMRHLLKHYMGITNDEETGLPHLSHAAWNALAILELELMNKDNNNG